MNMHLKVHNAPVPEPVECGSCHGATVTGLVCEGCGAIQPRPGMDKFAALGVPRRFAQDPAELEARYRDLSRRLHPDRFALAPARARVLSLQAATTLNDAYRTLKSPVSRAEYLLELEGLKLEDTKPADPGFLMEIMELREELQTARADKDARRLDRLGEDMRGRVDGALAAVAAGFSAFERERAGERAHLERVRSELVALRYYHRFLEELEGGEES